MDNNNNNNIYQNKPAPAPRKAELEYKLKRRHSPIPYIATGAFIALYAVISAMSVWYHFFIVAIGAIVIYSATKRMFPPVEVKIPVKRQLPPSGDSETDRLLTSGENELKSAEDSMKKIAVSNKYFADDISSLIACGYKINGYVAENPDQKKLLRRYYNYYLPELDKLLKAYLTFRRHGLDGRNATDAMLEIEEAVRAMNSVFTSQLDKLLYDMTLDITTDIDVLEGMLSETDSGLNAGQKKKRKSDTDSTDSSDK